jgi:hypothetical protein
MDLGNPAICCQQRNIHSCTSWVYLSYPGRARPCYTTLDVGAIDPMPCCTPLFILYSKGSAGPARLGEFGSFVLSGCANNTRQVFHTASSFWDYLGLYPGTIDLR